MRTTQTGWCTLTIWLATTRVCDAMRFLSSVLGGTEPPLAAQIVRQYEQIEWSLPKMGLESPQEGNATGVESLDDFDMQEKQEDNQEPETNSQPPQNKLIESVSQLSLDKKPLPKLQDFRAESLKRVGDAALEILGVKEISGFKALNPFVHVAHEIVPGYIVVLYRPALLVTDLAPHLLRVLYHSLAQKRYPDLERYLDAFEGLENCNILLVGAAEAGLVANYHAAKLIRSHPRIAPSGEYRNQRNQIQVITFNSPSPYTPSAIQAFRMPTVNFLDFHNFLPEEPGFVRWGYVETCKDPCLKDIIHAFDDEGFHMEYFNEQALGTLNEASLLNGIAQNASGSTLATRLADQRNSARSGVQAAIAEYGKVQIRLMQDPLHACAASLQQKLQSVIGEKYARSQEFVELFKLESNWSLNEPILCTSVVPGAQKRGFDPNTLVVHCGFGQSIFASYALHIGNDEIRDVPLTRRSSRDESPMLNSLEASVDRLEETSDVPISAFRTCLKDLFDLRPLLKIFSPQHPTHSNFVLPFKIWPFREEECRAQLIQPDTLKGIYKDDRRTFIKLMTAPDMYNPPSCQSGTLPVPIVDASRTENYWKKFVAYVKNHIQSNTYSIKEIITHYSFERPDGKAQLQRNLLEVISNHIETDPHKRQFDCGDPHTLWHSENFCPKMCHVMVGSNFCNRVYISIKSDLKLSLRAANAYSTRLDKSLEDWKTTFQLKKDYEDRAAFFLKMCETESQEIYYLAVYLEGKAYKAFKEEFQY